MAIREMSNSDQGGEQQHNAGERLRGVQPRAGHATYLPSASFSLKAMYQGFDPAKGLCLSYPRGASRHDASLMGDLTHFSIWRADTKLPGI